LSKKWFAKVVFIVEIKSKLSDIFCCFSVSFLLFKLYLKQLLIIKQNYKQILNIQDFLKKKQDIN